jgi:hypothetical protein
MALTEKNTVGKTMGKPQNPVVENGQLESFSPARQTVPPKTVLDDVC